MEQNGFGQPGTTETCNEQRISLGFDAGYCVGDGLTEPGEAVFDDSPFSVARGFDMIIDRETMEIVWVSSHGSTPGNENPSGEDVLQAVRDAVAAR